MSINVRESANVSLLKPPRDVVQTSLLAPQETSQNRCTWYFLFFNLIEVAAMSAEDKLRFRLVQKTKKNSRFSLYWMEKSIRLSIF